MTGSPTIRLSDYVMNFVADLGVRHVFLVVGGGAMHLNDALANCENLDFVCNLHEQASSIAAENYSKATNDFGVALVTTGPGGTNAITGLAGAWLDSTPCLFISGQVKRADSIFGPDGVPYGGRQIGVQEVDIVSVVTPLVKYAVKVDDPDSIRYHLEKAVHLAKHGRPGPVWIDIPLDVQAIQVNPDSMTPFSDAELSRDETTPARGRAEVADAVTNVIAALNKSDRPMLFIGNGIRLSRAEHQLAQLIDALGIPLETTWLAIDLVGQEHPLFVGRPGTIAQRGANFAIQNCDFLLSIGARLDRVVTAFAPERFARAAYKVMVDIDKAELAKMGDTVDCPIHADAGDLIEQLLLRISEVLPRNRDSWLKRCTAWKEGYPLVLAEHRAVADRVSTFYFSEVLSEELASTDYIVSGSSGSGIELFLLALKVKSGQRVFHTTALGAMGFGIAAAIGACVAGNNRRTIVVDGDGGFQFNIQELETVRRLNLPIKFFVLNNAGYASIRASQTNFFGSAKIGCDDATGQSLPDIKKVAAAYGLAVDQITDQHNLAEEIRRVINTPGPVVCDIHMVLDEIRQPRVSSVQRADGSFVSRPLEDLWPFLDRDEFQSNMLIPILDE